MTLFQTRAMVNTTIEKTYNRLVYDPACIFNLSSDERFDTLRADEWCLARPPYIYIHLHVNVICYFQTHFYNKQLYLYFSLLTFLTGFGICWTTCVRKPNPKSILNRKKKHVFYFILCMCSITYWIGALRTEKTSFTTQLILVNKGYGLSFLWVWRHRLLWHSNHSVGISIFIALPKNDSITKRQVRCLMTLGLFIRFSMFGRTNVSTSVTKLTIWKNGIVFVIRVLQASGRSSLITNL